MTENIVRIDKWLWAARFYKTRGMAKDAITGGKVRYDGARCKPGKAVQIGATLTVRQGFVDREIIVQELSDKRAAAAVAQSWYQETPESIKRREEQLALAKANAPQTSGRPDKKQRRQIHRFIRKQD